MQKLKFTSIAIATLLAVASMPSHAADASPAKPAAQAAHVYTAKTPKLTRAQFDAYLKKPEQLAVIDVRRPDELISKGGFPVYLSIQAKDVEKNLAYIPKDRSLVTVSNHAGRAGAAADLLASKGFKVVGAVGAQDYEAEGGVLTKITKPEPLAQAQQ